MPSTWEAVYTSLLSEATPREAIADIVRHARRHNRLVGITGMLAFDGRHFCQYLEGPPDAVQSLLARIARDPRHRGFTLRHQGPLDERRFEQWSMAYGIDAEGVIDRILARPGPESAEALFESLLQLDLEPGLAF